MEIILNSGSQKVGGGIAIGAAPLSELGQIGAPARFARGMAIFQAGDAAEYCYFIAKGVVRLSRVLLDGRRHVADFRGQGDLLGFDVEESYDIAAEAVTDVSIIRYRRREVEALLRQSPKLQAELLHLMRVDVMRLQHRVLQLGCQTAKERLASFLIGLADRAGDEPEDGSTVELPMTRQDIGDYLGLTIETISRTLSELKRAGAIRVVNRTTIMLDDVEGLRLMAEGDSEDELPAYGRRGSYQALSAHH